MANGLNLALLDQFNKKLDDTYAKLQLLDQELVKFNKLTTIDIQVGSGLKATTRALDELARAVSRLSAASPTSIRNVGDSLLAIVRQFEVVGKLASHTNTQNLSKFLTGVSASLRTVQVISDSLKTTNTANVGSFVTNVMKPLFQSISTILFEAKNLTPARIQGLNDTFRSVGGLFRTIADIANQVQNLSSDTLDPKLFKTLKPFIEAVLTLMQASEKITPERLARSALAFESIGTLFRQIGVVIESLAPIKGASALSQFLKLDPVSKFTQLTAVVRSMLYLTQSLSSDKLGNLAEAFKGLEGLFRGLGDIINLMQDLSGKFKFPTTLLRQILVFERIIAPIVKVAKQIAEASQAGGGEGIAAFESMVRGLSAAVSVISSLQNKFTGLTNLFRQIQILERVGGVLSRIFKNFASASQGVNPAVFDGITSLVKALAKTIRILLDLEPQFAKFFTFTRSADILERAGGRLKNIFAKFASIKIQPGVFDGLSKFVPAFLAFFRELSFIQSDRSAFKDIGKSIAPLEDASKRLGKIFKNIADGFSKLGIAKDALKDIATILTALEKLDQVQEKLAKLKDSAGDSGAASIGVFNKLKDVISAAVTEGILRASLLLKVFGVLKGVILDVSKAFLKFTFPPATVAANLANLKKIGDALREVGETLRDLGEQMRDAGNQLISSFGIGNLFNSAAVQSAVGFDALSTQVQVFGNLTDEAVIQAEELAFVIGQKYPLSANDALAATLDLIKAGQGLGDIEFTLPAAADLAALSETGDLNGVINTLIAAEGSFESFAVGVEGTFENIAIATDIIAAGANVSTASVESLGEGLANVGTAANAFGLSLEETVAVLAIFNDAGLASAEGGTALRSLLSALDRPQTAQALQRLGIALFDPATGARKPLNEIINDIGTSLDGLPEAQRVAVLQELTDTFGRQGLNILLDQGADGIANVVTEMQGLPTAGEQATQLLDNLAGDLEQLTGSFETFMLRAALPMIERFFRPFVQLGRLVIDTMLSLDQSFFEFLGTATALLSIGATLVGGLLILSGTILQVGGAVFTVVGTLLNFQLVLGAIVAGTTAFIAGILAISAAVLVFVPLILTVTSGFELLFQVFSTNAGGAASAAQAFFGTVISTAKSVIDFIGSFINVISVFIGANDDATDTITSLGETFAAFFSNLASFFTGGFIGDMRVALGSLTEIFNTFAFLAGASGQIGDLTSQLIGLTQAADTIENSQAIAGIQEQINLLRDGVKAAIPNLVASVPLFRNAVQAMFGDTSTASIEAFTEVLFDRFDRLAYAFTKIKDTFISFFSTIFNGGDIGEAFQNLGEVLNQELGALVYNLLLSFTYFFGGNEIIDTLMTAISPEGDGGPGLVGFGQALITLIVDSIRNAIVGNRDTLKDMFLGVVDFFFAGLKNLRFITDLLGAGPISDLFESFQGVLRDLLGGVFDTLINLIAGQSLGEALYNAFGDSIKPLFDFIDTVSRIFTSLQEIFSNIIGFFTNGESLGDAAEGFFDFEGIINNILGFFNSIADVLDVLAIGDADVIGQHIQDFFAGLFTNASDFVTGILPNIGTFLSDFLAELGTAFEDYLISIGVPPEFIDFGHSVFDLFVSGIGDAFKSVSDTATTILTDPKGFFGGIASQLKSFIETDGPALFKEIGTSAVTTVVDSITNAFAGIEDVLNIDFQPAIDTISTSLSGLVTALEELLFGNEAAGETTILTDIINLINEISTAITGLFTALSSNQSNAPNQPLQFVLDFVAGIGAEGIDTITDVVVALDDLLDFFLKADPEAIASLGVAIAGVFVAINFGAIVGAISAAASAIAGFVASAIPLIAAFIVVRAFLQNVGEILQIFTELGEGDIGGAFEQLGDAILNIFADITEGAADLIDLLLGLFGIKPINFDSDAAVALGRGLATAFVDAAKVLEIQFDRLMADLGATLTQMGRAFADSLIPGDDTELQRLRSFFQAPDNFSLEGLTGLKGSLTTSADLDFSRAGVTLNQEQISRQIREEIAIGISEGEPIPINADQVVALSELGALPRIIEDAIFAGDFDIASAILSTDALSPADVQTAVDAILLAVRQGFISAEEGQALLVDLEVDPTWVGSEGTNTIVADAQAELRERLGLAPIPIDVPVEVVPVTPEGGDVATFEELEAQAAAEQKAAQEELNRQAPLPILVPYETTLVPAGSSDTGTEPAAGAPAADAPIADSLNLAGADAQTVAQLSADLAALQTYAQAVKVDLDALLPTLAQLGVDLGVAQVAFDTINVSMLTFSTQVTSINLTLQTTLLTMSLILLNLGLLGAGFTVAGLAGVTAFTLISLAMSTFNGQLTVLLNTLIQGFIIVQKVANELAKTLANVVGTAQDIAATVDAANTAANGGEPPAEGDGHAQGGSTRKDTRYQVAEGGPEVYFENGKMYLISRDAGRVIPLGSSFSGLETLRNDASTGTYPTPASASARQMGGGGSNISIGDTSVQIRIDGAGGNATQIANEVAAKVEDVLDRQGNTVRRTLRRNHR